MTENKRFTITGDRGISDHQKKRLYDLNDFDGMISVTECLNELHDENQFIKHVINEALSAERTELGKSVLKQLKQQIEVR